MTPFKFEHAFRFTEKRFVQLNGVFIRKTKPLRLTVTLGLAVAGLFWSYTLVSSILVLAAAAVVLFAPRFIPGTMAHVYRRTPFLHEELTYGISHRRLWVKGPSIDVRVPWRSVQMWEERDGWLRLSPFGVASLWFPIAELKEAGVYDRVMELCREHAPRFGSAEAKALARRRR